MRECQETHPQERKRAPAHASATSQSSISETDLTDHQHTVHNTSTENSSVVQPITATKYSMHSSHTSTMTTTHQTDEHDAHGNTLRLDDVAATRRHVVR